MEAQAGKILVRHLNIRQSISVLLFKLISIELFAGFSIFVLHFLIFNESTVEETLKSWNAYTLLILITLVLCKTAFTIFIVVRWLEEYYEISDHSIMHRKGFVFKKEEEISFKHIRAVKLEQGLFGRILNFGTLVLHDWDMRRDFTLYQIHNPNRYKQILVDLIPDVDVDKRTLREHIIEPDE